MSPEIREAAEELTYHVDLINNACRNAYLPFEVSVAIERAHNARCALLELINALPTSGQQEKP